MKFWTIQLVILQSFFFSCLTSQAQENPGEMKVQEVNHPVLKELGVEAEACRLFVPENREKSDSNVISLAFVRLKSTSENPGAPLVYLSGGPGQAATPLLFDRDALTMFLPFLELGDVILLDQRGTGRSEPNLTVKVDRELPEDVFASEANMKQHFLANCRTAAKHFREQGVDLSGYTTLQSAADINDIRIALNVRKLNLLGFSYGTHLALAAVKYHGEHLENVVLANVEGLDQTIKLPVALDTHFSRLALLVERDGVLGDDQLADLSNRVFDKLSKDPITVSVKTRSGAEREMAVGKFALQFFLRMDIGDTRDLPFFPRLLKEVEEGETSILSQLVQRRLPILDSCNVMTFVMDRASGVSELRRQRVTEQANQSVFGDVSNFPFYDELDEIFEIPDLGSEFREPIVSDVRTLFLSGTLDWNTPPYQAEQIRFGFSESAHITVVNAGHEQVLPNRDVQTSILDFLSGKEVGDQEIEAPELKFLPVKK